MIKRVASEVRVLADHFSKDTHLRNILRRLEKDEIEVDSFSIELNTTKEGRPFCVRQTLSMTELKKKPLGQPQGAPRS